MGASVVDEGRPERTSGETPYRVDGQDSSTALTKPKECRFTIPVLPPSVNALHQIIYAQRRVELKPEVRKWKYDAKPYIPRVLWSSESSLIRVDTIFYYRIFTADGTLRVFDTQNALKPLIDLIAEKQGWNDKRAKGGSWDTVDSMDEKVEVVLREITRQAQ